MTPTPLDIETRFVQLLAARRRELGLSQAAVAQELRRRFDLAIDPTSITRMEAGERRLRLNEAFALAAVLQADFFLLVRSAVSGSVELEVLEMNAAAMAAAIEALQAEHTAVLEQIRSIHDDQDAHFEKSLARSRALLNAAEGGPAAKQALVELGIIDGDPSAADKGNEANHG